METYNEVMVDLETFGQVAGAGILSIGAVAFTAGMPQDRWKKFYMGPISRVSNAKLHMQFDSSTMDWWEHQAPEAKKTFVESCIERLSCNLPHALKQFKAFFPQGAHLWGNGADFDNAILAYAYRQVRIEVPWEYRNNRCYRTMKAHFKNIPKPEAQGISHHALDDAINQARHLNEILQH